MTKILLLIMAAAFGIRTAKDILQDFHEDASEYIINIAIAFYMSYKSVFLAISDTLGVTEVLPVFDNELVMSGIKALINLVSSGVFVPITTLYVTYRFKKWLKRK